MSNDRHGPEMFKAQESNDLALCVCLDTHYRRIPQSLKDQYDGDIFDTIMAFNRQILWAVDKCAAAYMVNDKAYKAAGHEGLRALRETIQLIHVLDPKAPVFLNNCDGDTRSTTEATIDYAFGYLDVDGLSVNALFGRDAVQHILDMPNKSVLVLARTSGSGAPEFQDLPISRHDGVPFWRVIAHRVHNYWNTKGNCALLMGPMSYEEPARLRNELDVELPFFVTGISQERDDAQFVAEGDVAAIMQNGSRKDGTGVAVCVGRPIIFAKDPRAETYRIRDLIKAYRKKAAA